MPTCSHTLSSNSHFCHFYKDTEELLEVLLPYFKEGLLNNEYCVWVTSEALSADEARAALQAYMPDYDWASAPIEFVDFREWYLTKDGRLRPAEEIAQAWLSKQDVILAGGYSALRVTGNTIWLDDRDWPAFRAYEQLVDEAIGKTRIHALCSYGLDHCAPSALLEIVESHTSALFKVDGRWQTIETREDKLRHTVRLALEILELRTESLRGKEELIRSVLKSSDDCIKILDLEGRLLYVNAAGQSHMGITDLKTALNGSWFEFWQGPYVAKALKAFSETKSGQVSSFQGECRTLRGDSKWWDVALSPILEKEGKVFNILASSRDITAYKLAEEELRMAQQKLFEMNRDLEGKVRERTELAEKRAKKLRDLASALVMAEQKERHRLAQVLHDNLQQMLIVAKFGLSKLQTEVADQPQAIAEVRRIEGALNEAVMMSRSFAVELCPPILKDAGLNAVMDWLARWFKEKYQLEVEVISTPEVRLLSEETKIFLFQTVRELLLNVIKHAEVPKAAILMSSVGNELCLTVEDKGKGFDVEATSDEAHGFGLFHIAERLEMLNGRMDIESAPGKGARFAIYLPLPMESALAEPDAAGEAVDTVHEGPAGTKTRILVVDDHKILREGLINLLKNHKDLAVIGEAQNGNDAILKTQELRPDVIIMDISMPQLNGIEATRQIKAQFPEVHIIALSLHESADVSDIMREAGVSAYYSKTNPIEELIRTIHDLCPPSVL